MNILRTLAATATAATLMGAGAEAAVLNVTTTADTIAVGETFAVDITFSAETAEVFLAGLSAEVSFDDGVFSFVGADFVDDATGLNQLSLPGDTDAIGAGIFDVAADDGSLLVDAISENDEAFLQANQADDFTVVSLTFLADNFGTGSIGVFAFIDAFAEPFGLPIDVAVSNDTVSVSAVPLPGAALFMATGAAALIARRRRA